MKVDFLCMYACLCIFVCVYFCGVCVCNVDMPLCAFEVHLMLGTERGRRLGGDDGQSNVIPAAVFFFLHTNKRNYNTSSHDRVS